MTEITSALTRMAGYFARTMVSDAQEREEAAQEALIAVWKAPEGKPRAYYEVVMRNRINDFLRGVRLSTEHRANHGGHGPKRVLWVSSYAEMPESPISPPTPTDLEVPWVATQDRPLDRALVEGLCSGSTVTEVARDLGLSPVNVRRYWQRRVKPALATAWKESHNADIRC